ncbi:FecR family protein [Chitinophaga sp. 30R24]|uniref:FecR family protein n=1 Tax=Chitinophaga sp. 30R24 TaxID=3248838 RepID=UPI003B8EDDF1
MRFKTDAIFLFALLFGEIAFNGCNTNPIPQAVSSLKVPGIKYTSYTGTVGSRTAVTLPDSSHIILNSTSMLEVPENYLQGNRAVILDGEAFFSVTPATDTFTVTTDKLKATVLGTSFRMRSFANQHGATVYLLQGKMQVSKSYYSATDNAPEILERGQMILANNEIDLMEKETYQPGELETWLSDTLRIQEAAPVALPRILEDWFGVEIEMQGDAAKAPPVSATFYHASLSEVLQRLSQYQHFKYKMSDNKAVIKF